MGGPSWRRRLTFAMPVAAMLAAAAATPSLAEGPGAEGPVIQIDRVLEIDRVIELRRVDALTAEVAAAQAAAQAAVVPAAFVKLGQSGIPVTVLAAYRQAEANLAASMPSCHLSWWVLAGIGRIESGHASGGRVDQAGTTRGRILGPRLDGSLAGSAVITDTDGGALDGDPAFDRAVGPMQFLPRSWQAYARDGNGDKVADPNNVFDAATTAGVYLCRNGGDLSVPANLARAILAYNHSDAYLQSVLSWGYAYRDGVTPAADGAGSVPQTVTRQPETTVPTTPAPAAAAAPPSPTSSGSTPASGTPSTGAPSTNPPTTNPTPTNPATTSPPTTNPTPTGDPTAGPAASPTPTPTPTPTETATQPGAATSTSSKAGSGTASAGTSATGSTSP